MSLCDCTLFNICELMWPSIDNCHSYVKSIQEQSKVTLAAVGDFSLKTYFGLKFSLHLNECVIFQIQRQQSNFSKLLKEHHFCSFALSPQDERFSERELTYVVRGFVNTLDVDQYFLNECNTIIGRRECLFSAISFQGHNSQIRLPDKCQFINNSCFSHTNLNKKQEISLCMLNQHFENITFSIIIRVHSPIFSGSHYFVFNRYIHTNSWFHVVVYHKQKQPCPAEKYMSSLFSLQSRSHVLLHEEVKQILGMVMLLLICGHTGTEILTQITSETQNENLRWQANFTLKTATTGFFIFSLPGVKNRVTSCFKMN